MRGVALQRILEQKEQVRVNQNTSRSYLSASETAIAKVSDVLNEARVATGSLASLSQLSGWDDLWDSRYGQLLSVKLLLVAGVVGIAGVARRTVGTGGSPWRPVRYEAVGTVAVLALTSALAVTPPGRLGSGFF